MCCILGLNVTSVNYNVQAENYQCLFHFSPDNFSNSVGIIPRELKKGALEPKIPEYHLVTNVTGSAVDELEMQREALNGEPQGSDHLCACLPAI